MKKLIYCALALAAGLFATSCMQENLEPVQEGNTVIYTVEVPDALLTKAIGDDVTKVDELVYEVYRTNGEKVETITEGVDRLLYHETAVIKNGKAIVPLEFINNQNFTVLFWAHSKDNGVYDASNLTNVTITSPDVANNVNAQAFVGRDFVVNSVSAANRKVTLTRPVSQLNIGTTEASLTAFKTPITLAGSSVKVSGLSTSYNVAALSAGEATDVEYEYTETEVPTEILEAGSNEYIYVGMNYIGFAANEGSTIKVAYAINTSEGTITNKISNVPVKPNYRTNIVGNLITSTSSYTIELDEAWGTDGNGTMEVINNGVVRNVNGDYEVTNAEGLAFAMNNLFALGGNFYLTKAEYDLTNYTAVVPTITKNLNIHGETPVVTRSATTVAGVTIKGLDGAFLPKVDEGSKVTVSGVTLEGAGTTVLVGENDGTVIVYETTADTLVETGNNPVAASAVETLEQLTDALDAGAEEIKLIANIEAKAEEVIEISKSVVINGNGNTLYTSANRAIRIEKGGINVVINNLKIVSSSTPGDRYLYGISFNSPLSNSALTLNDCDIQFTYNTTLDNTYAVNIVGGTGHKLTVNGGNYVGANVINVWGNNHNIYVDGAVLTSLYAYNPQYVGCCVRIEESNNKLTVKNSTFNGSHAVPVSEKNEGQNTIILENNIDKTSSKYIDENGVTYYTVASLDKLQDAIDAASTGENIIKLGADIEGDVTVIQKQGVKITIDGNGKKYDGSIKVHSNSYHYADAALTIKNVNFEASAASVNIIEALENGSERYSTNITVEDCTFTATGDAVNTAVGLQIKASKWAKVLNCTATNMHSLIQAQSCDETVVVNGCTINGKNGVAFKQVKAATVEGTTITALEYGIRFDGNIDNYGITVKNNNVTAVQPFIVRKMTGANNTITLEGENTLTTDDIYQIVITNGSDDEDYVTPTGTYTLTGADNFIVYPRDLVVSTAKALKDALKENSPKIYIAADIIISENWDAREAKPSVPVMIDGLGHTLKFTNTIDDKNYSSVFRFENDAVVKNLKFDLSEAVGTSNRFRAISAKTNLTVDNCEFIGNPSVTNTRGIIFGEGHPSNTFYDATVSITNCNFVNWRRGITDNENATDVKEVLINNNNFDNANVGISAYEKITFNGNKMYQADVNITSYTASCDVTVQALENSLYPYGTYEIGSAKYKFNEANVNAPGFTVSALSVAKVGETEYGTLQKAFNVGGNITLLRDVTVSETATLDGGKTAVLDLNGKTLTANLVSALASTEAATLTVKNGKVVAYESTVRAIGGKVIVESGEYISTGTALDSPATYRYSLDCREGGELIINGGTFKSNNGLINVGSTVTINGGKFENIVEKSMTRHFAYVSALLTINDGEFYGKANSSGGGCFFCGAAAGGDIQVKGGKFTSLWTSGSVNKIFEVYFGGTINVTGGMFNTNGGIATFVTENTDEATKAAYPYVAK